MTMYERAYGHKYAEIHKDGAYLSAAAIAKLMRADIRQAIDGGLLPAGWRYSVTVDNYSMGRSIDIKVKDCADAWVECPGYKIGSRRDTDNGGYVAAGCGNVWCKTGGEHRDSPHATEHLVLTEDAQAAMVTLKRIHWAYNHDGSDITTDYHDVSFYGQVGFQDPSSAAWEAKDKADKQARKAATDTGTVIGRVVVIGRRNRNTHLLVDVGEGAVRLACGAPGARRAMKVPDDTSLSCSRCAKKCG